MFSFYTDDIDENCRRIHAAMKWYEGLKTEELAHVIPQVNQGDSRTIVEYWWKTIAPQMEVA